ncbi:hypothetical protein ABW20_dc0104940 [Dactylellina cionopaga]|nr:hypothetical protein ABW20_dc0104940 [Dactylellina cionopaga]
MGVTKKIIIPAPRGAQVVKKGDKIRVDYIGTLAATSYEFDSTIGDKPFELTIGVGEVIKGWDYGILAINGDGSPKFGERPMQVGESAVLFMSSDYGYGPKGAAGVIPPNADLIFQVKILGIIPQKRR